MAALRLSGMYHLASTFSDVGATHARFKAGFIRLVQAISPRAQNGNEMITASEQVRESLCKTM